MNLEFNSLAGVNGKTILSFIVKFAAQLIVKTRIPINFYNNNYTIDFILLRNLNL